MRQEVVLEALLWLKEHNCVYADVDLNFPSTDQFLVPCAHGAPVEVQEISTISISDVVAEKLPKKILSRSTNDPVYHYDFPNGEEMCFPHLFPYGINGYNCPRNITLHRSQYFHHRMGACDRRFRKNITYLLHAVSQYERGRLLDNINVHMRMHKPVHTGRGSSRITAADVCKYVRILTCRQKPICS